MTRPELRELPAVDAVLREPVVQQWAERLAPSLLTEIVRQVVQEERQRLLAGESREERDPESGAAGSRLPKLAAIVSHRAQQWAAPSLAPVINATGIVLHTNLGRARLSQPAQAAVQAVAAGYSNLEFDLATGERGDRYTHVTRLLTFLTGAEDALVVNNNAGAVLLAIACLARDRGVVVSRGELVEIGGSFRVPEVMEQSGARLIETGTTNKTYLADYARAITEDTALLLKVHPSNFRIIGFTHQPSRQELVGLGREKGIPVMEDLGSGLLLDLQPAGYPAEPLVSEVVAAGVEVVTFSGDKLLGGPQAGIIVGRRVHLARMKRHPLLRALRIDKLTLAALEATLRAYLEPASVWQQIPTLQRLTVAADELQEQARSLVAALPAQFGAPVAVQADHSQVGGGSMPGFSIPTWVVAIKPGRHSAQRWAEQLRRQSPPVICRIQEEQVLLDMRTVLPEELPNLARALTRAEERLTEERTG